jgi:hypothetical protein
MWMDVTTEILPSISDYYELRGDNGINILSDSSAINTAAEQAELAEEQIGQNRNNPA